jgi:hypothetical protein
MWLAMWVSAAAAEECTPVPIEEEARSLTGVRSLIVRGVVGAVDVAGAPGDQLSVSGAACGAARVKLTRSGDVATLTVTAPDGGLEVRLGVPADLRALGVYEQTGALVVHDVPGRVTVVGSCGAVEVTGAASLRLDGVVGAVVARGIGGEIASAGVTGGVQVL